MLFGTALTLPLIFAALPSGASPEPPLDFEEDVVEDAEEEAAALLEKGEEQVGKGQHKQAVSTYGKLAKRFPDTEAAAIARRRMQPNAYLGFADVMRTGPSENRVDIVLMGDGYVLKRMGMYDDIAGDVPRIFERNRTFKEYVSYLNILRANVVSEEDGIDGFGREYSTALGGKISAGTIGSQVTVDRELARAMLAEMPQQDDMAIVLVKKGTLGTGGGGIAAVAAHNFSTLIHEWGHAFANLQDEYSTHTGFRGDVTNSVNVSNTPDPERVPWAHWIAADVRGIGIYEGADGRVRGAWKPTSTGCIMGDGEFFCMVCREAIVLRIHEFVDPIENAVPDPIAFAELETGANGEALEFVVTVTRPASHNLEVSWWVLLEDDAPSSPRYDPDAARDGRRAERG
ncbi:MAG: M64 family metallo-endopeptidase, partial [Planctomycetota bacterium]|nr:M64 family metallo-endopeptidase [Planctomycetota bacterium]